MKTIAKIAAAVAAVTMLMTGLSLQANAQPRAQVKGGNVQMVVSADAAGNRVGTIRNMGNGTWMEDGLGGRAGVNHYQETGRDEWSVFLRHASGSELVLNIYRKRVMYRTQNNGDYRDLYSIAEAMAGPTGRTVKRIAYNTPGNTKPGYFYSNGKKWLEMNSDGRSHFVETSRDDWSVFLYDSGRQMKLQIDLYTGKVKFLNGSVLYDITAAQ